MTLLILTGLHPKAVSARLGRSSITPTIYSYVRLNVQKETAEKLEALLFSTPERVGEHLPN